MTNFNYNEHKVVGVAKRRYENDKHAELYPLGYINDNYYFEPFSKDFLYDNFLNNGIVFGPNFKDSLINKLISFHIRESELKDEPDKDWYTVDYSSRIEEYEHTTIVNTDKSLTEIIGTKSKNTYFKRNDIIYFFSPSDLNKGIVQYWLIEEELFDNNKNLCQCGDDVFLIRGDIESSDNYRDIYTIQQIVEYVIEIIKNYNITPENYTRASRKLINVLDIPTTILESRLNTFFNKILPRIALTYENIQNLCSNNILSEILQQSIKEYEDSYIKTFEENHKELINKLDASKEERILEMEKEFDSIKSKHLSTLDEINDQISNQKQKLLSVEEEIKVKSKEANTIADRFIFIESQKERLIKDFSIIQEVIGGQKLYTTSTLENLINIKKSVLCGEEINNLTELYEHLEYHLKKNIKESDIDLGEVSKLLTRLLIATNRHNINMNIIMLPSLVVFKSLMDAIGKYTLISLSVGVNWKSFHDLYNNGLKDLLILANENPKEIHILLLQNMNLSHIPSYMQPINDILIGINNKLPGNHNIVGIPSNLWIIGTRTSKDEEAIPISVSNINEYACLEYEDYEWNTTLEELADTKKILTIELIDKLRKEGYRYKSFPESYLD